MHVFLSIGTWKESWVYLPGTELKGVYPALISWRRSPPGRGEPRPARWPLSAAATPPSIRPNGAAQRRDVTVFYRRERKDMPAIEEEIRAAGMRARNSYSWPRLTVCIGDAKGNVKSIEIVKHAAGRIRLLRSQETHLNRRNPALRLRFRHLRRRRDRRPRFRPRASGFSSQREAAPSR
jgi:NADPH-dependent glutamate synthase beta subunit-like oxidoreductase